MRFYTSRFITYVLLWYLNPWYHHIVSFNGYHVYQRYRCCGEVYFASLRSIYEQLGSLQKLIDAFCINFPNRFTNDLLTWPQMHCLIQHNHNILTSFISSYSDGSVWSHLNSVCPYSAVVGVVGMKRSHNKFSCVRICGVLK